MCVSHMCYVLVRLYCVIIFMPLQFTFGCSQQSRYILTYSLLFIGRVCVPIDPSIADDFDPFTVPTLRSLMDEVNCCLCLFYLLFVHMCVCRCVIVCTQYLDASVHMCENSSYLLMADMYQSSHLLAQCSLHIHIAHSWMRLLWGLMWRTRLRPA